MSLQQVYIAGYNSGLRTNQKPFMIPDEAFSTLENAYVWRERVKKREGLELIGRLRRALTGQALGNTDGAGNFSGNIISILSLESTAEIETGSITVTVGAQVFTEPATPDGTLSNGGGGTGTINYATGALTIDTNPNLAATPVTISFRYFPGLPVMGIWQREIAAINDEQTIFWDTKYAYIDSGAGFTEFIAGTTWAGTDSDFFWATNFRGSNAFDRLFFVTNFVNAATSPMRYTDGLTWTTFNPIIADNPPSAAQNLLYQARILIPYYGRLLALNTYEGTTAGGYAGASNFFNRCRFSQIGSPIAADAWRSDQFGKGGFIDAPTNEAIISAQFFKNTLIVGFERSTWQLRYVGEYGLPFIWERISSDYGTESQFSTILFDQGVLQVGDKAITSANAINVERIDLQVPDFVFNFKNTNNGRERVQGVRDFAKELVFWTFVDTDFDINYTQKYPNKSLLFNYRNNTYAIFRNSVTAYGTHQLLANVTWDSLTTLWDDDDVFWDDLEDIEDFPAVVSGNQQGFVHFYNKSTIDDPSLAISGIDFTQNPIQLTVTNHNLENGEWVQVTDVLVSAGDPGLNSIIYTVGITDANTITLFTWNGINAVAVDKTAFAGTYLGEGKLTLFPQLNVETKDFNPFQQNGTNLKLSYVDFLMDAFPQGIINVNVLINATDTVSGNVIVGNKQVESDLEYFGYITNATQANPCVITSPNHNLRTGDQISISDVIGMTQLNNTAIQPFTVTYIDGNTFSLNGINSTGFTAYVSGGNWETNSQNFYVIGSQYAWHRFFATCVGQFLRIQMTYDNNLMSNISTHTTNWVLNAMSLWVRPGSKNLF